MYSDHRINRPDRRAADGFTLVEVMVVVAIVAILAMVALPAYNESVRKSRRSEAFAALTSVQQAQERWRGSNATYADSVTDLLGSSAGLTPSGYYNISVEELAEADGTFATGYIASATAVSGTSQASDGACSRLKVRMLGGTLSYAGCPTEGTCAFTETNACWVR
jgi:type IV pilus assembly protein PilE